MGTRTFVRQDTQIRQSDLYEDTRAAGSGMESAPANIEDDLNNLRSQVRRVFFADDTGDWFSDVPVVNAKKRGLSQLGTDLDDIEEKPVLFRAQVLTDVSVPASQSLVVLSVAGGEAPTETAAVSPTQDGAVVSVLGLGALGAHALDEVAGSSPLAPKNLLVVRDAGTGQPIQSGGKDVFGLLQAEDGVVDGDAFDDTSKRVQISFVRENATGDDLEAVPAADIGGKQINYGYVRRLRFDDLPEEAFLAGSFVDATAVVDVTLDNAIANQPGSASQSRDIDWNIADGFELAFTADAGARDLLRLAPAAGGDTVQLNLDTLDINNVNPVDLAEGLVVDSAGTPINLGVTPGQIDSLAGLTLRSGGAGDLSLLSAAALLLADANKAGSAFAASLQLSGSAQEWNDYESQFGEVSLLQAIVRAKTDRAHDKAVAVVTAASIPADTNVTGAGASPNLDVQLLDYSGKSFTNDVNVYLNGTLLRSGPDALADHDVYPGGDPATGDLKFEFNLKGGSKPDVITMEVF